MHKLSLILISVLYFSHAQAQYISNTDIGITAGTSYYIGDVNPSQHFKNPGISVGGLIRYNVNNRYALLANLRYSEISGSDDTNPNDFEQIRAYSFNSQIIELAALLEFNFFPYTGYDNKAQFTPYVAAGIAAAYIISPTGKTFAPIVPIGLGIKANLGERINFSISWIPRISFTDNIEGMGASTFSDSSPYSGKQRYFASDNDWYAVADITISIKLFKQYGSCSAYGNYK